MKKVLLISLAFIIGLAVVAQRPQLKSGVFVKNFHKAQAATIEPAAPNTISPFKPSPWSQKNGDNSNIVTVLNLGTSANVLGYYVGSRTMVWADDDLNAIINFHRAGPGTTYQISGYLAMDLGVNMGATQADWTNQIIVANALLPVSPSGYAYDANRYPNAGIYNPAGNTTLANAYCAFIAPNFCNLVLGGFGGYSYGSANLVNFADTNKTLRWWDGNPPTYIPSAFTVSTTGIAHAIDGGYDIVNSVYIDSLVYGRGIWNATTTDFDYTFKAVAMPCRDSYGTADEEIAASPDGNTIWMCALTNYAGGTPGVAPLIDSTFYPLLRRSVDGGQTWEDPIPVYLDGPNGIAGIKNHFSDYFIQNFFVGPPWPTRDEIPYTCAFDHGLAVDKWGNPHIAVVVGYAPGTYSISTGVDSLLNVYDIYSVNDGATFNAVHLGSLKTFRGTWGDYSSDNRVYIASDKAGEKMFVTYNDTRIDGVVDNQNPEVYARGFNLLTNMITADEGGADAPNNVTFLSDITQEAYMQCTSRYIFTDDNKYTVPICTQWWADPALDASFKYIPDFSYVDSDFSILVGNPPFPVGLDKKNNELATVAVYPNPVKDIAKVTLTLKQSSNVTVNVTNLVGQQVMTLNKGSMTAGSQQFTIDASNLTAGVYFITVTVNGQKFTQKMVVE